MNEKFPHKNGVQYHYQVNLRLITKYQIFKLCCIQLSISEYLKSPYQYQHSVIPKNKHRPIKKQNQKEKILQIRYIGKHHVENYQEKVLGNC